MNAAKLSVGDVINISSISCALIDNASLCTKHVQKFWLLPYLHIVILLPADLLPSNTSYVIKDISLIYNCLIIKSSIV